jgi:hypothetical protein
VGKKQLVAAGVDAGSFPETEQAANFCPAIHGDHTIKIAEG